MICYSCCKPIIPTEMRDFKVTIDNSMYPRDFVIMFHVNGVCEEDIYNKEKEMEEMHGR